MNDDRCYHVAIAPGQTMCSCLDYTVWLRFVIQTQAAYIADLERRMHTVAPRIIAPRLDAATRERALNSVPATTYTARPKPDRGGTIADHEEPA